MQSERYFSMRAHFYEREKNLAFSFKLQEIETIWSCTNKNVKRILKDFVEKEWLTYIPGKGRGNPSKIIFFEPFQTEIEKFVKQCLEIGELDQAAHLLRLPIPKSWVIKASPELRQLFSHQKKTDTKDILHGFITRELTTLDPLKVAVANEAHLIEQLGDPLLKYNDLEDKIIPHLAHHYESDETHQEWTLYLRKGILFHDREELTSRDVASTLDRVKNGPPDHSWMAEEISEIECPNPYKVIIRLKKPNAFFSRYLASSTICILPTDIPFNEYEWIGTGPFFIKERNKNKLVLRAFDGYFKERPLLDEIHFFKVSQDAVGIMNYTVERNHTASPLSKNEIETGFRFLAFNFNKQTVVQHSAFREAVFHILDMKVMADDLEWDEWIESSSFIAHRSTHQPKHPNLIPSLLNKSGYVGERLTLFHLNYTSAKEEARWFADQAKKYGISLELRPFDFHEFYGSEMDAEVDLIFMGEVSSLDPHLSFLGAFYNQTLLFRRMFPSEDLQWIDERLDEIKKLNSAEDREKTMTEIEAYIREKHLLIFQHHPVKVRTFHPLLKDVQFQSFGHFDFSKLWIPN